MHNSIHTLAASALIFLTGCVAEIPELPDEYQNKSPVVQPPTDTRLIEGSKHSLELSVADDRDTMDELTFDWTIISGHDTGIELEPDGAIADLDVPWQQAGQASVAVKVSVTDKDGDSTTVEFTLTIVKQTFLISQAEKERKGDGDLYRVGFPVANPMRLNQPITINESIDLPSLSPNGQRLAFVRSHALDGDTLVVMNSDGEERLVIEDLPVADESFYSIEWSPKGKWLSVVTESSDAEPLYHLHLVDSDGEVTSVTEGFSLQVPLRTKWSNDERHLAMANNDGELLWFDADSAETTPLYTTGETGFDSDFQFHWHPREPFLAYTATRDAVGFKQLYLATPDTLQDEEPPVSLATSYGPATFAVKRLEWSPSGQYLSYTADLVTAEQDELFVLDHQLLQSGADKQEAQQRVNGSLVAEGDVQEYRWDPDEVHLAYLADQEENEDNQLFFSLLSGENNRQLTDFSSEYTRLFWDWSGAGNIIYVHSKPAFNTPFELTVLRIEAGQKSLQYETLGQPLSADQASDGINQIKLSPNRMMLALQSHHNATDQYHAWLLDLTSDELQQVTELNTQESDHRYQWSPNGDGILYLTYDNAQEGKRLVFQALEELPVTETSSLLGELAPNGSILDFQMAQ